MKNLPANTSPAVRATRAPAPPAKELSRLGPFALTALLSDGRFSRVFRARPHDAMGDGTYVVKLSAGDADGMACRMLRREAAIGRSVSHAHIIPVLSCQTQREPSYVVMPYLAGATLRDVLEAGIVMPPAHALWIVRQVADALAALHRLGWRHGDVKPENIHIAPNGHATLLDLGLAQRLNAPTKNIDAILTGTLRYAAPECFVSAASVRAQSDIYSLGVVLYEMLTGRPPFDAEDPAAIATAHLECPPPPLGPNATEKRLPGLSRFVNRLLAKDAMRRPCAAEAVADLCRFELRLLDEELACEA